MIKIDIFDKINNKLDVALSPLLVCVFVCFSAW